MLTYLLSYRDSHHSLAAPGNRVFASESSARVKNFMLTHVVAVSALQTTEDNRRYDRRYPERDESLVYSLNHFGRIGLSNRMRDLR